MSKQRKSPEQVEPDKKTSSGGPESATPEHAGLGNAAIQARIAGGDTSEETPFDVVRDTALPMVGRAAIALQVEPRGAQNERLIDIVQRSDLPQDRKDAIAQRLVHDERLATGIHDAMTKWFGSDGVDVRRAVEADLGRIESALADGRAEGGGWRAGDTIVALSTDAREGAAAARAEALIADLARATSAMAGPEAMQGFCRDLHLALMWLEEEDEEYLGPDPVYEVG